MTRWIPAVALAGAVAACSGADAFEQDVIVVLSPESQSVATGEEATFRFDARGTALIGMIFDFGDSVVDSVEFFGATEAGGYRAHAFGAAGTFGVQATVLDALNGVATDSATVIVTP